MTERQYNGKAWQEARRAVLDRDGRVCQIRLPKCKGLATEVDHVVPVSRGGARLDPANLQAACRSCNIAKRNHERNAIKRGLPVPVIGSGARPFTAGRW